jgi:DNA gyrase subunit A
MARVVLNQLYKHTRMESSFGIIFLAVVDGRPELLNLKQVLEHFVYHRKTVVIRRTRFDLKKAEERAHILLGLKIALENLDAVVALIRRSASPAEAKAGLIGTFGMSAIQAQAVLDMRLQRLTGLERDKILDEYAAVLEDIERFKAILASDQLVLDIIKDELSELQETFGDPRRTEIVPTAEEITMADLIAEEDMVVTITRAGYIKRTPASVYQSQRRGGKGKTGMVTKDKDFVHLLFVASTHHTFLFFTNLGRVYWRKVYEIPRAGRTSVGKNIVNLLEFGEGEKLTTVLAVESFDPGRHIIMATRDGLVKKTDIMAYSRPRAGGIIALDLAPGDELIAARITDGTRNVFLVSANGKAIRFHEADVRTAGRVSRGVRGLRLESGDRIVGMEVLNHGQTLFAVTENGYGKRTAIDAYPVQRRGGKGVITIKTSRRNGLVVGIALVEDEDDMMLVTNRGMLIRIPIAGVATISRNTQGVTLMDLAPGEKVVSMARLAEGQEDEEEEDGPAEGGDGD